MKIPLPDNPLNLCLTPLYRGTFPSTLTPIKRRGKTFSFREYSLLLAKGVSPFQYTLTQNCQTPECWNEKHHSFRIRKGYKPPNPVPMQFIFDTSNLPESAIEALESQDPFLINLELKMQTLTANDIERWNYTRR
jgi:hypothetical protein